MAYNQNSPLLLNIPLHCVNICHSNWFNKEVNWTDRMRLGERAKLRILGERGAESGVPNRRREKQDGHDMLRKVTKPHGKAQVRTMG